MIETGKANRLARRIEESLVRERRRSGEMLESIRDLAARYSVTTVTIGCALALLEAKGLVRRIHGKGTLITALPTESVSLRIGILMPYEGHFYAPLFSALLRELTARHMTGMPYSCPFGWSNKKDIIACLGGIKKGDIDALLVYGMATFPFEALKEFAKDLPPIAFLGRRTTEVEFKESNAVLADLRQAGRLACRRLLGAGCKHIAAVVFRDLWAPMPKTDMGVPHSSQVEWAEGINTELLQHGAAPGCKVHCIYDDEKMERNLAAFLRKRGRKGFASMGDHRCVRIYQACARAGIAVGDEVSVVGLYNTPWVESLSPHLTSVSLCEEELAKEVAVLLGQNGGGATIYVPPKLVERQSCGHK